jgi:LPXTG-motif cell wall-anchored protein
MIAMFAIMAATALAASGSTYTITVQTGSGDDAKPLNGNYYAYELAQVTYSNNKATGVTFTDAYKNAVVNALNSVDTTANLTSESTNDEIIKVIEKIKSDSTTANEFAAEVYKQIGNVDDTNIPNSAGGSTISVSDTGYYLIVDKTKYVSSQNANSTNILVNVAGNTDVSVKTSLPAVEKKVYEDDYSINSANASGEDTDDNLPNFVIPTGYNDVADYDTYTDIQFMIIGSLPTNYDSYTTYSYKFTDTAAPGFTINRDKVKVYVDKIDGTDITENFDINYDKDNNVLTVSAKLVDESGNTLKGLKQITSLTSDNYIVVTYTAQLNANANVGKEGNVNTVYLEYSNNPNFTGEGTITSEGTTKDKNGNEDTTGQTPEDKVIVFTYDFQVSKVDDSTPANKLADAEFKLYRIDSNGNKEYATVDLDNNLFTGWGSEGTTFKSTTTENIIIKGLDEGTYYFEETNPPTGYNTAADTEIKIVATTVNGQKWTGINTAAITALTVAGNSTYDGSINGVVTIVNHSGTSLPTTGGIGTTILYVIGGILVICAGVALITKKRMKNAE